MKAPSGAAVAAMDHPDSQKPGSPVKFVSIESDDVDSDSGDESPTAEESTAANRQKALNYRFKALLAKRAEEITANDIETAIKATADSELSMTNLIAKQEFASVIHDPREYQLELFEKAKKGNIIAVLDTGSGKTLIAVLLLKHVIEKELEDRQQSKPRRISFFLVDSVTLVYQQAAVLQNNIDQKVDRFCGAMQTDLWNKEIWDSHFKNNMIIVCTAEVLYQCLLHSFIRMDMINLLIFDEAHHAKKEHPYARIIKDFYFKTPNSLRRPKIFGMTASPVDAKVDVVSAAKNLENMLDSQIATASNLSILRQSISRPNEESWVYDRLDKPFETSLYAQLHDKFGDVKALEKIFKYSLEASSSLGSWCSDWVWGYTLNEETLPKFEARVGRDLPLELHSDHILDAERQKIRAAEELVKKHVFDNPVTQSEVLSPKVRMLYSELSRRFDENPDTRCIVFTEKRHTARILRDLFKLLNPSLIRPEFLIGVRATNRYGLETSFREQFLNVIAFRKGEINCLFATSIAEEGLDIQDCNLIVRFDLYSTLIQYIQSRGRARHMDSTFVHMVERNNLDHEFTVREVKRAEDVMARFCKSLPEDRILKGYSDLESLLDRERYRRSYTIKSTGAKLTYSSSLAVLSHYASSLQYEKELSTHVNYVVYSKDGAFVCEAILPEKSPVRGRFGRSSPRKALAKQSAAFETCLALRENGLLDDYFISTYHRRLPAMRNARLAITSRKTNQYKMMTKPLLWETHRGTVPKVLYATVLSISSSEDLNMEYQPLVFLSRVALQKLPSFPLYLENNIQSDVISTNISQALITSNEELDLFTRFTLRIFQDVFHKVYENQPDQMDYWIAPVNPVMSKNIESSDPREAVDWDILQFVRDNEDIQWSADMTEDELVNRFIFDKWDGRYRYFSLSVDRSRKPSDPPPQNLPKRRSMKSIMDYCLSLYKNSRLKFLESCDWNQPVFRAELVQLRRNFLDKGNDNEKEHVDYYICLEALRISAIPAPVASFALTFPAILSRIESYLIASEACKELELSINLELALEALTKDSDNTDEHRLDQVQFQRGMGKNYERLEFLGDCFLKMSTSISLFAMNPDNDEFDFHVKRMVLICNKNLFNHAIALKIYEFVRSKSFSRRGWYPEGLKLLQGKASKNDPSEAKHALADKTIADVCEALIGASLLSGGSDHKYDTAVKAVSKLVNNDDHRVSCWAEYKSLYTLPSYQTKDASATDLDLARQIEEKLGYNFRYPRLLRSAFTHSSYPSKWADVPCYQRLEFLGDSLLDMVSVNYLFAKYADKDPQWLTEHKMAMVSNKFLGYIAVHLGINTHLRHFSNPIQAQITKYAEEVAGIELSLSDSPEAWMLTQEPPKCLADMVEAYIGAIFVDSGFSFEIVEDFFERHLKWHFEDMSAYDTYANRHPIIFLQNKLWGEFGCTCYAVKADEIPSVDGSVERTFAAVFVHDDIIAEGVAASPRYAKLKASEKAVELLGEMSKEEFQTKYRCDCEKNVNEKGEEG